MNRSRTTPPGRVAAPVPVARPAPVRSGGRSSGFLVFALILLGVPIAFAGTPTLMLIAVGMLPTLVALVVDRSRDKLAAITVGPMNVAGLLLPLTTLWFGSNDIALATTILSRPANGALVYGAAAVGWMIYFTVPGLVARGLVARRRQKITDLSVEQKKLVEAWGEDVKGRAVVAQG